MARSAGAVGNWQVMSINCHYSIIATLISRASSDARRPLPSPTAFIVSNLSQTNYSIVKKLAYKDWPRIIDSSKPAAYAIHSFLGKEADSAL